MKDMIHTYILIFEHLDVHTYVEKIIKIECNTNMLLLMVLQNIDNANASSFFP